MASNCVDIWSKTLSLLKENLNEQTFITWFKPIVPINLNGKKLTVQIPSHFFYEFLDSHYRELINRSLQQIIGDDA